MELLPMTQAVLKFAESCIGYREYKGNQGFQFEPFDNIMRQNGFQNGWAWCMLFAKACYTTPIYSGKSKILQPLLEILSPGAVDSFNKAKKSEHFKISDKPVIGSIAIWQKWNSGVPDWRGHAGITSNVWGNKFECIEGNTNSDGGREGVEVARMSGLVRHDISNEPVYNGLNPLGFIMPVI